MFLSPWVKARRTTNAVSLTPEILEESMFDILNSKQINLDNQEYLQIAHATRLIQQLYPNSFVSNQQCNAAFKTAAAAAAAAAATSSSSSAGGVNSSSSSTLKEIEQQQQEQKEQKEQDQEEEQQHHVSKNLTPEDDLEQTIFNLLISETLSPESSAGIYVAKLRELYPNRTVNKRACKAAFQAAALRHSAHKNEIKVSLVSVSSFPLNSFHKEEASNDGRGLSDFSSLLRSFSPLDLSFFLSFLLLFFLFSVR